MSTATMSTQTPISDLDYLQKIHRLTVKLSSCSPTPTKWLFR